MKLIFSGVQGSGKGTQARKLKELYGYEIVETGEEFRKITRSGSELGNKIATLIDNGKQVTEELGKKVFKEIIELNINKSKVIFDGLLRNQWNLDIINETLKNDYLIVHFELTEEEAIKRLKGRMYDEETGETFPKGTEINPTTGNKLVIRKDDSDIEFIKERISQYNEKTLPIINNLDNKVIIDGSKSIDEVFEKLVYSLNLK